MRMAGLWGRVIKPIRPRTSSLGSDSPSSQDTDATSVEPRTLSREEPAFPRRTARPTTGDATKRCVSSNPATDSRNRAPAGCSAPGGSHARVAPTVAPVRRPRNESVETSRSSSRTTLELSPKSAFTSGPVARDRNLALPSLAPLRPPRLALRQVVSVLPRPDVPLAREPSGEGGVGTRWIAVDAAIPASASRARSTASGATCSAHQARRCRP